MVEALKEGYTSHMKEELDTKDELEKVEVEMLLEGIYRYYGLDFRNYVFPSIKRRIHYQMQLENVKTISALQEKVLHDPKAMEKLFDAFSIHITEAFRDPSFFLAFRKKIIPYLQNLPFIRIWHAGCSTGEEVYSMAILLEEENLYKKTRIYATDMNEKMIQKAKTGCFDAKKIKMYADNYFASGGTNDFANYYSVIGNGAYFHKRLAENMVFAQHNLVTDGSFNEFHVVICRNVLIYFNKTLQNHVHQLFYESLSDSGFLGLGSKEGIRFTNYAHCYKEVDTGEKLYQKSK